MISCVKSNCIYSVIKKIAILEKLIAVKGILILVSQLTQEWSPLILHDLSYHNKPSETKYYITYCIFKLLWRSLKFHFINQLSCWMIGKYWNAGNRYFCNKTSTCTTQYSVERYLWAHYWCHWMHIILNFSI